MKKITTILAAIAFVGFAGLAQATEHANADCGDECGSSVTGEGTAVNHNNINIGTGSEGTRSIGGTQKSEIKTVPDVVAPGLTTTLSETCMGSSSGGAGWLGFGFSFGTTWRDSACVRRLDSRQILAFGVATKDYTHVVAAKELMCDSKKVRAAYERAGIPCVQTQREQAAERSAAAPVPASVETASEDTSPATIQKANFTWPNYAEDGG